ncbi:MAG: endonuclease/exonuclease/phosphatase family protein [Myxococcales bacterium]|nr:endonuclease/exonuclease/phosphatase family protein [Myxococcales bacterium]
MRSVALLVVVSVLVATTTALAGGLLGGWHPIGDSLAVFRVELATVAAVAFAGLRWLSPAQSARLAAAGGWVGCAALGLSTLPWSWPSASGDTDGLVLYQKNLSFRMRSASAVLRDIAAVEPDFITLQEVRGDNRAVLQRSGLPHLHICPFAGVGSVAIASAWPVVPGTRSCAPGMARMQVRTPSGDLWLASVHLHWPWPHRQSEQLEQLARSLQETTGDWLVGGDFNMVPWSHTLRTLTSLTHTRVASGHRRTFPLLGPYRIPIDHVLVPSSAQVDSHTSRPLAGSDHHGVVVRFVR